MSSGIPPERLARYSRIAKARRRRENQQIAAGLAIGFVFVLWGLLCLAALAGLVVLLWQAIL
jgi:hypothetical protein